MSAPQPPSTAWPPPPAPPDPPPAPAPEGTGADPTRSGAVWITGTGAALLLAAAAVFVAVRWADIPAAAKLGAVTALTGGFLVAGRRLRDPLPATAGALFHLGAFLVPVDVAALAVRARLDWGSLLLVEGVACAATFALAARTERSVVLRWAAAAAAVVAAAGIGATTAAPTGPVLAGMAVVALVLDRPRAALAWAATAGLAPVGGLALGATAVAPGVLDQLGLGAGQPALVGALTGVLAAGVLWVLADRRHDPGLALLGLGSAVAGIAVSGEVVGAGPWAATVGAAALFVAVELVALLARDDRSWARPTHSLALVAEALAVPASACAAAVIAVTPLIVLRSGAGATATGLLAAGCFVADLRRRAGRGTTLPMALLLGGRCGPATVGLAVSVPATIVLATGSGPVGAVALLGTAAALLVAARRFAAGVAVVAGTWAPITALGTPEDRIFSSGPAQGAGVATLVAVAVGVAGTVLLAHAVRWRCATERTATPSTWLVAVATLAPLLTASAIARSAGGLDVAVVVAVLALSWQAAAIAGGPGRAGADGPATGIRLVGAIAVLGSCGSLPPAGAALVASLLAALVVVDAVRLSAPPLAWGLVAALPVLVSAAGAAAGLTDARTGVALVVGAVVIVGTGSLLPRAWWPPLGGSAAVAAAFGLVRAAGDGEALADALLLVGGAAVAIGLRSGRDDVVVAGGVAGTLGAWSRLVAADVVVGEPYVLPVAALLLLAGWRTCDRTSSWVATGPAVALLGGAALVERIGGGGGWHALVVGAVGVAAVAAGGVGRLAAPLVLGTGLLAAIAVHESLAVTAGVPTWAWLALGGTTLIGVGVALERAQLGPLESGRRLVDAVQLRYR